MLSEASASVIYYELLFCIKANVEIGDADTVCDNTRASSDHLFLLLYSFNRLKKHTHLFGCLLVQMFHSEIVPCFVALNPHDLGHLRL